MSRYLVLLRFTDQGTKNIHESPARARGFAEAAEKSGIKIETQLWTAGAYDGVLIVSGNDEAKLLGTLAKLAAQGNVRTESLRAFDGDEFAKVAGS
jgi:uncharacterized protein with GYD domain